MRVLVPMLPLLFTACGSSTELDDFSASDVGPADFRVGPGPDTLVGAFTGRSDRDGRWQRIGRCDSRLRRDGLYPYTVERFENGTERDLRVTVLVDWDFDGYLHIYDRFDEDRPFDGCVDANDDFMSTAQSRVTGIPLPAGDSIDIVLSGFTENEAGSYSVFVINE